MFLLITTPVLQAQSPLNSKEPVRLANDFSNLLALGDIALKVNQFETADDFFREALNLREPWDSYTYIHASLTAYLRDDTIRACSLLHRAIASGASVPDIFDLTARHSDQTIIFFEKAYNSVAPAALKEFACSMDIKAFCIIRDMVTMDQCIRNMPQRTVQQNLYLEYMGEQDSIRFMDLVKLVEIEGWPTFRKVGNLNSFLPLLLMHNIGLPYATDDHWVIILDAIREAVMNGTEDGLVLAMIEDIILQRAGLPQRYGTQSVGWDTTPTYYVIENCINVDAKRSELGLIPLSLHAQQRELQLPSCYPKSK